MTTYSYQFTHHTNSFSSDYKFMVYLVHSPFMYDFIREFDGQEALKHYQTVQSLTPEQLQQHLSILVNDDYDQKCIELLSLIWKCECQRPQRSPSLPSPTTTQP